MDKRALQQRKRQEENGSSNNNNKASTLAQLNNKIRTLNPRGTAVVRMMCIAIVVFSLVWRACFSSPLPIKSPSNKEYPTTNDNLLATSTPAPLVSTNTNNKSVATSLQKAKDLLLQPPVSTKIEPRPEWLTSNASIGYPVRQVWSSLQYCRNDEDFTRWIRVRKFRWFDRPNYLQELNIWQKALTDKIGGYLFAKKMGVITPKVLFCTSKGPSTLVNFQPPPHDAGFVVKNIKSHSSKHVYVMEHGFGGVNRITQKKMTLQDIQKKLQRANATNIYIEELIQSGDSTSTIIPDDYKFYTFNGTVESIRVVRNRGTERACMAFYDAQWNRQDVFGCFKYTEHKPSGNRTDPTTGCYPIVPENDGSPPHALCSDVDPPATFFNMLEIAQRLGTRIGVFMRIDLFENAQQQVVLGEFTPFCSSGGYHCTSKITENGCVDPCFLGRAWKQHSLRDGEPYEYEEGWYARKKDGRMVQRQLPTLEGGPITPEPEYLKGWGELSMEEKCARLQES